MFRSVCIFVITVFACAFTTSAYAGPAKPLSEADKAEAQGLIDYMQQIMNDANAAMTAGDPVKACNKAQMNEIAAVDLDRRTQAFITRLKSDGKFAEGMDVVLTDTAQMVQGTRQMATGMCGGDMAKTGNPKTDAARAKFTLLMGNFTTASNAQREAELRNDAVEACKYRAEANTSLLQVYDFMVAERAKLKNGTPEAAQTDEVIARFAASKQRLITENAACSVK